MLLCSLDEIEAGMTVAAAVLHPLRPEMELLKPGVVLDAEAVRRLREVGVPQVWVEHDALAGLEAQINPEVIAARRAVYQRLRDDFTRAGRRTVSTASVQSYRQAVMDLVCQLLSGRGSAGLTDQLFSSDGRLFSHCANVAYLSLIVGLQLRSYIVRERPRLSYEHAMDLTNLGLGAMLHDIGKTASPADLTDRHEATPPPRADAGPSAVVPSGGEGDVEYRGHTLLGAAMLRGARSPASAIQAVLHHHQRWDGSGWPRIPGPPQPRADGRTPTPQKQRGIHVFSRIVAVANVLENLLTDGQGRRRPPVAALAELMDRRFDGWFDPLVRSAMLRHVPPFPIGSLIHLSDGRRACVLSPGRVQPCRPVVRVLEMASAHAGPTDRAPGGDAEQTLDLEGRPDLHIARCGGHDVGRWLFEIQGAKGRETIAPGIAGTLPTDPGGRRVA